MEKADVSMWAQIVCRCCGMYDTQFQRNLHDKMVDTCTALDLDPMNVAEDMIAAYGKYKASRNRLQWAYPSAKGFLLWEAWDQPADWPWKDVQAQPGIYKPAAVSEEKEVIPDYVVQWRKQNGLKPL
jgi:hypothetical protein